MLYYLVQLVQVLHIIKVHILAKTLSGGSGNGAIATVVTSDSAVTSINITTQGSGYAVNDVLTISGNDIGRNANLKFTLVADDFELLTTANALLPSTTGASATHNKGTYTGKTLSGGSGNGAKATVVTSDSAVTL